MVLDISKDFFCLDMLIMFPIFTFLRRVSYLQNHFLL